MNKNVYNLYLKSLKDLSKEELIQKIITTNEIIVSDREFANHCLASSTVANMNEIFRLNNLLQKKHSYKIADNLEEAINKAEHDWNFIVSELESMKESNRVDEMLSLLKDDIRLWEREDCKSK